MLFNEKRPHYFAYYGARIPPSQFIKVVNEFHFPHQTIIT